MSAPALTQADSNLWAAYANQLKSQLGNVGSSHLYVAPLSTAGIAAGPNIDPAYTNFGVYNAGDSLLDPDTPVFMPGRNSFFQRSQEYARQVEIEARDRGAAEQIKRAQEDSLEAQGPYAQERAKAMKRWTQDTEYGMTNDSFSDWARRNAPMLQMLEMQGSSHTARYASAAKSAEGPEASKVGEYITKLDNANKESEVPRYNMKCAGVETNKIAAKEPSTPSTYLRPSYSISSQYADNVGRWIQDAPSKKESPKTISFTAKDGQLWSNLGFSSPDMSRANEYAQFCKANFNNAHGMPNEYMSAETAGSELSITITATDLGIFAVTPGQWHASELFKMRLVDGAKGDVRKPAARVNSVVMGYNIGMKISFGSNTSAAERTLSWIKKAEQYGGSVTIFGYNIGLGPDTSSGQNSSVTYQQVLSASSGSTVVIPASENSYPTLMAVIGEPLPTP